MANIGKVTIRSGQRTAIVSTAFAPKPNIALAEIRDVSTLGVENGDALVFSSANNRFETKIITATVTEIIGGTF